MIHHVVAGSMRFRALMAAIAVVVVAIGVAKLRTMPLDIFPEILPITVTVQTEALGLSAAEVEQLITVPIEADLLSGTPWVDVMRSESVPGLSSIELTFKPGSDPMHARQVVQERLTQAHALPNVSKPPQMLQPLSSTNRIMLIGLSSETQNLIEMSVLTRWTIRPRLMGVPGVANVSVWGQRERQLQVQVDPERLRKERVSLIQIIKTAGNALWYSPLSFLESSVAGTGGFIETPNQRLGVRHVHPITVADDLAKVPVEGTSMRLGQVATVVEDHQPLIGDALNGHGPGLLLVVEKLPGVNTLEVTDGILAALDALTPGLGGIKFDPNVYQPAGFIRTSIGNVASALMIALILVGLMLLVLSYDWRAALVGLIAIPTSLMVAVLVMGAFGASMNMMVVAGLIIALGVLVDDGIVLTNNLLRRLRTRPGPIPQMLLEASSEMRGPLVFATVIVLLAALPMLFMTGVAGAFVKPMVTAYAVSVLASMVVSILITPAVTLLLFRNTQLVRHESPFSGWLKRRLEGMPAFMPRVAVALVIVATVAGLILLPRLDVPAAPRFREPDLLVHCDAVPGTSRLEMTRILGHISAELKSVAGVRDVGGHVGRAIMSDQVVGIHSSELWVSLDPQADYDAAVKGVEGVVASYPGVDSDVMTYLRSRFGEPLARIDEPIVVRLYGQEIDVLRGEAEKIRQSLAGVPGVVDPSVHLEASEPVLEIKVDLDRAAVHGVKPGDVRRAAATLLAGIVVGNLFEAQKVFEVVVWGEPQVRHSLTTVENLWIDTPGGGHVRLGDVADLKIAAAPNVIQRENVARTIDIVASVQGRSVNAVAADVHASIRAMALPLEYRAELVGDFARQETARTRVLLVVLAVAIGMLFVFHATFGGWSMALAVLLTLPLALAGGVIAAAGTGTALSLGAFTGFLTVFGLVVRHGVMLVHRYREMRREGVSFGPELVQQGARESAVSFMTAALVTAAAVLPFVLAGNKPGHEILGPMALVILGGLVTAAVYTMWVVPALYARFGAGLEPTAVEDDLDVAV